MKKIISLVFAFMLISTGIANACTNFLVGKKASVDGSTMVTYNADSWYLFGALYHRAAATYPAGTMMDIYEWDTGKHLGQIEQATTTYNVIGNMNEYQLTIGETTFGGREELADSTGLIDYGSLIYITLQRSKTAREAIYNIVTLVNKYGYYSEGESFSIVDPNEVWIMELIGKGPGSKGFVWVARRVPDDCVCAHANQARITTFPLESKKNKTSISSKNLKKIFNPEVECVYAEDVITFARQKGYFDGKDEQFNFSDAYCPLDFTGVRCCDGRVWSFFNYCSPSQMEKYASYIRCETKERMPLWIKADKLLSVQDLKNCMRDHYEGTEFDMSTSMGCGTQNSVYRATPLTWKYEGKEYFHERPTGTQQTGFTFVAQMRSWLPRQIGGLFWFGVDDATCSVYIPIYCSTTIVPEALDDKSANMLTFNWNHCFWVNNVVANMAYYRYNDMMPDIKAAQSELENYFNENIKVTDEQMLSIINENTTSDKLLDNINNFAAYYTDMALKKYQSLAQFLMVKFVDGCVKKEENGKFIDNGNGVGIPTTVTKPGYSDAYKKAILVDPNPERYRIKSKEEMDNRK